MDRELPIEKVRQRKRRKFIIGGSIVLGLLIVLFLFNQFITIPVKRSEIIIAEASTGNINATLNATGTVQPEFEEVITSPVATQIRKVLAPTGSSIDSGVSILELDLTYVTNQLNQSIDQLNLNSAKYEKARLNLEKSISDLENQRDIKKLKNEWYKVELENTKKLFDIGGVMGEEVKKADLDYHIAVLEFNQLENQIKNLYASKKAQLQELELNIRIQERLIEELRRKVVRDQLGLDSQPDEKTAKPKKSKGNVVKRKPRPARPGVKRSGKTP